MFRAVTFDFWNTLMWEEPGSLKAKRLEVWTEWLRSVGVSIEPADLERAHDAAHRRYEESWRSGRQFRVDNAAALIADRLPAPLPDDAREVLVDGFSEAGRRAAVHPAEGVEACLAALGEAGVRLGIICDIGLTPSTVVRCLLDRHGLLDRFDDATFSDEAGLYKPAPGIFERALSCLGGVAPGAAAHVGDRRRTDVAGARTVGMTAVRYNGVYEDEAIETPEADIVTDDLAALPELLGVRG